MDNPKNKPKTKYSIEGYKYNVLYSQRVDSYSSSYGYDWVDEIFECDSLDEAFKKAAEFNACEGFTVDGIERAREIYFEKDPRYVSYVNRLKEEKQEKIEAERREKKAKAKEAKAKKEKEKAEKEKVLAKLSPEDRKILES